MAMANMNFVGVFVKKLWPVQALVCRGGGGDGGDGGGATKNIIPPKFSLKVICKVKKVRFSFFHIIIYNNQ